MNDEYLTGTLYPSKRYTGRLIPIGKFYNDYIGPYEVTPNVKEQQILNTTDRVLHKDVTIKEIPYFDVSNTSGGSTVYIGSEV